MIENIGIREVSIGIGFRKETVRVWTREGQTPSKVAARILREYMCDNLPPEEYARFEEDLNRDMAGL